MCGFSSDTFRESFNSARRVTDALSIFREFTPSFFCTELMASLTLSSENLSYLARFSRNVTEDQHAKMSGLLHSLLRKNVVSDS